MGPDFNPRDWFWIVGGDDTRAWSSAIDAYVATWPTDCTHRIGTEAELTTLLEGYGLRGPLTDRWPG